MVVFPCYSCIKTSSASLFQSNVTFNAIINIHDRLSRFLGTKFIRPSVRYSHQPYQQALGSGTKDGYVYVNDKEISMDFKDITGKGFFHIINITYLISFPSWVTLILNNASLLE